MKNYSFQITCSDKDVIKLLPRLRYIDGRPLDAISQKLKKFRKWWTPYLTTKKDIGHFSKISFDVNTDLSLAEASAKESTSNQAV